MLHNGTRLPLYAMIVWGLMLGGDGLLERALSIRPLTALGDSSYVLYILQAPLIQWMVLVSGNRYDALGLRFTLVALPVVIVLLHRDSTTRSRRAPRRGCARGWRGSSRARRHRRRRRCRRRSSYLAGSSITSMRKPPAASSTRSRCAGRSPPLVLMVTRTS